MNEQVSKRVITYLEEKAKVGEMVDPAILLQKINNSRPIKVSTLEEADYIRWNLNEEYETLDGVMTDVLQEIFLCPEYDNEIPCIESRTGPLPVSMAIEKMKEKFPKAKAQFLKDYFDF